MAVPKRKVSKARTRTRKAAWMRMGAPALHTCTQCGEACRPHRVCPRCGHYKKREVVKE
ncbi:MAG: 50S ribosomal protein L32 [Deltaproteobacteria bacterium]|nr:50S ribosomal protein L32 [Deltaproteobacteria bacterium]